MKTAVFYDLENIGLKNGELEKTLETVKEKIQNSVLTDSIILQRAYISKTHPTLPALEPVLKSLNIELVAVEQLSETKSGKKKAQNLVDFKMAVDVIATVAAKRSISTVAIASGDNDFGFICRQIKDMGKNLLVISKYKTTGDAMLSLCDDWIDLSEYIPTPKFILKIINRCILKNCTQTDFSKTFSDLISRMENDLLVRRYLSQFGIGVVDFFKIVKSQDIHFPPHTDFGFAKLSDFANFILDNTKLIAINGVVFYRPDKKPIGQKRYISERIIALPHGYTRDKFLKYYDILDGTENITEFLEYISFVKHNGVLADGKLCYRRNFRSTIRKNARRLLSKAGVIADETAISAINEKL